MKIMKYNMQVHKIDDNYYPLSKERLKRSILASSVIEVNPKIKDDEKRY